MLKQMKDIFSSGKPVQAITGLSGVGKTQTVLEYVDQNKDDYDVIWWMEAGDPILLASEYAALSNELGIKEDLSSAENSIKLVIKWLEHNSNWLLIFDNAKNPEDICRFIPHTCNGHTIITSYKKKDWDEIAHEIILNVFDKDEAVGFLLQRTGQTDKISACNLAEGLYYLPLALEQAGAFIRARQKTISEYLEMFKKYQLGLLEKSKVPRGYHSTVTSTWEISFNQILKENPLSAELLNICSFFAPERIPLSIIARNANLMPEELSKVVEDELQFDDTISVLHEYSLVDINNKSLYIHGLIQKVVRKHQEKANITIWAEIALKIAGKEFHFDDYSLEAWKKAIDLYPHIMFVYENIKPFSIKQEYLSEKINLLSKLGVYLLQYGLFDDAKRIFLDELEIAEAYFSTDRLLILNIRINLATILYKLGDFKESKKQLKDCIVDCEEVQGPDSYTMAVINTNLGSVLEEMGEYKEAQICYEKALELDKKLCNNSIESFEGIITDYNNLAIILRHFSLYPESKKYYEEALAIAEKNLRPEHELLAKTINNLGVNCEDIGEYDEALKNYQKAKTIYTKIFGSFHPRLVNTLNNIGDVLVLLERYDDALMNYMEALKIDLKYYGKEHCNIARDLCGIGDTLRNKEKLLHAECCYKKALDIDKKSYGESHPYIAKDLNGLVNVLISINKTDEAVRCCKKALEIDNEYFGEGHPYVARDNISLGNILKKSGKILEGKACYEIALNIYNRIYGPKHPKTINAQKILDG